MEITAASFTNEAFANLQPRRPRVAKDPSLPVLAARDEVLAALGKETLQARVAATRSPFIPPSNSASSYIQLKRLKLERAASSNQLSLSAKGAFLQPSAEPLRRKPTLHTALVSCHGAGEAGTAAGSANNSPELELGPPGEWHSF